MEASRDVELSFSISLSLDKAETNWTKLPRELLLVELLRRCSLAKFPPSGGDLSEGVMMALGLIGGCFSTFVAKLQNDSFLHSM